jgi:hypothetical protein
MVFFLVHGHLPDPKPIIIGSVNDAVAHCDLLTNLITTNQILSLVFPWAEDGETCKLVAKYHMIKIWMSFPPYFLWHTSEVNYSPVFHFVN